MTPSSPPLPLSQTAQPRLMSLDALRGFDMFWIVGAEELIRGLQKFSSGGGVLGLIAEQLHHKAWAPDHKAGGHFLLRSFRAWVLMR